MTAKTLEYAGPNLLVRYEVHRCIHAAKCVHGLPQVFDPQRKPWIELDAADADQIIEVVEQCPTGALTYERLDGIGGEVGGPVNTIEVGIDGPLFLRGQIELQDESGATRSFQRLALCRCGASEHKPFCDGSHSRSEFSDDGTLGVGTLKSNDELALGPLALRCREDGPVVFHGTVQVNGADGTVESKTEGALCRCGGSAQKPYCDGSHKQRGFKSR